MPRALFAPRCDRDRPSLHDVGDLATEFRTSLTATALRFVAFSAEPCAVVHSTNGVVGWADTSADFRLRVANGMRVSRRTYAGDLHAGASAEDASLPVEGDAWSDDDGAEDVEVFEHSRRVAPASVLTFLWHRA